MTGVQLALDCDPTWTTTARPAPVDSAVREQRTRHELGLSPCSRLDILGQNASGRPIRDVNLGGEWL